MSKNTRLPGHTLSSEGKPFAWTSNGGRYVRVRDTNGYGVGLCSCGKPSPKLDSDAARKRWHTLHKDEIRRSMVAAQETVDA